MTPSVCPSHSSFNSKILKDAKDDSGQAEMPGRAAA